MRYILVMSEKTGKMKCGDMRKVIEAVDEIPTADVRENVKGKWIKKKGSLWSLATCSVCGELSVEGDKPFCPNCGAQMIGDKENDERI